MYFLLIWGNGGSAWKVEVLLLRLAQKLTLGCACWVILVPYGNTGTSGGTVTPVRVEELMRLEWYRYGRTYYYIVRVYTGSSS